MHFKDENRLETIDVVAMNYVPVEQARVLDDNFDPLVEKVYPRMAELFYVES